MGELMKRIELTGIAALCVLRNEWNELNNEAKPPTSSINKLILFIQSNSNQRHLIWFGWIERELSCWLRPTSPLTRRAKPGWKVCFISLLFSQFDFINESNGEKREGLGHSFVVCLAAFVFSLGGAIGGQPPITHPKKRQPKQQSNSINLRRNSNKSN